MGRSKSFSLSASKSRNTMIYSLARACQSADSLLLARRRSTRLFRGPFLQFFHLAPNQALSFVIKLTNFGTHRYTQDRVWLDVMVDEHPRRWYGDSNVFRWHHDWPLSHGSQIQSGLMALEQWLYEQIDNGIRSSRQLLGSLQRASP